MADFFPGSIQIGGRISRKSAFELFSLVVEAGISVESDGVVFTPRTPDDVGCLALGGGALRLRSGEARYGHFDYLESWLEERGIPYDQQAEAAYEWDASSVCFRPGYGRVERPATQAGEPMVAVDDLLELRQLLVLALDRPSRASAEAALTAFDRIVGPQPSPLPPFVVED